MASTIVSSKAKKMVSVVVDPTSTSTKTVRLQDELDAFLFEFMEASPQEMIDILVDKSEKLAMSGIVERAVKEGDIAPHFNLPNVDGKQVSLHRLIMDGPLILTFYRGEWCPYCK